MSLIKEGEKHAMRIMSFNLLCGGQGKKDWYFRSPLVVRTIYRCDPDTFGVQEAHFGWMKALCACLPEYDYVGVGRNDGKEDGEFSAVFYKKEKYELLDSGSFWLSETPERPGKGWDAACIRICSWAKLKEKVSGKEFVHLNTHLDHIGKTAMQKGAELVARSGAEIALGHPAFFTGDFNVTPDSAPYRAVLSEGFTDCRSMAKITDTGITFHNFNYPAYEGCVIDYVFAKGNVSVEEFAVIRDAVDGDLPSDHFPVYADVTF